MVNTLSSTVHDNPTFFSDDSFPLKRKEVQLGGSGLMASAGDIISKLEDKGGWAQ